MEHIGHIFTKHVCETAPPMVKQSSDPDIRIRTVTTQDLPKIYENLARVFDKTRLSNPQIWNMINHYDPALSVVAEVGGKVAGFYFLGRKQIQSGGEGYEVLKDLEGIEGIALGVFGKYRNQGVGKRLIDYSRTIPGFQYIWGYQLRSLDNREHWLKRRKLYKETDSIFITYELFQW